MNDNADQLTVDLPQGEIRYRDEGSGEPIVFVHGFLVDGTLWREVTPRLAGSHRCIVPDLPLGSHRLPMRSDADLSPPGLAHLIDDFMAALGLEGVTLVANDTGGAIAQLVAINHPERLARLVLTPSDTYKDFFPPAFRYLQLVARIPGGIPVLMQTMRPRAMRRAPIAYGWLTKRRIGDDLLDRWVEPAMRDPAVRRDAVKMLRGVSNRSARRGSSPREDRRSPSRSRSQGTASASRCARSCAPPPAASPASPGSPGPASADRVRLPESRPRRGWPRRQSPRSAPPGAPAGRGRRTFGCPR